MAFWLAAGVLALAVAGLLVAAALARGGSGPAAGAAGRVHASQLREIERDARRGLIAPDEALRLRAEVARRLIEAERTGAGPARATRGPGGLAAGLAGAAVLGGAVLLYADLGAPGYPDLPMAARLAEAEALRAARLPQAEAEAAAPPAPARQVDAEFLALMDTLRARVAERPDDLQGHFLLVQNEARLGRHAAAARAQGEVIRIKGAYVAPEDHVLLARMMIAAAGGAISPEAEAALEAALRINPDQDEALFLAGLSHLRLGRPDLGFAAWSRLIATAPGGSPWLAEATARIGEVAAAAGVDYALPADLGGPSAADIAAAAEMTPEARDAMVGDMVEGLAARLASEGGPASDWARLVTALAILGDTDRARAVAAEAEGVFAGRAEDLAAVRAAAEAAGL
ncbi:MAG: c-type cytochrome biogenesis protein CcmI [Gemmobacter sp.]